MSETLLVRGARQLLTLHGSAEPRRGPDLRKLGIVYDGALLIEDGRIVQVGPSRRIENLTQARRAQEIDATGRVVMPGFVDCDTHLTWPAPWSDDYEAQFAGAAAQTSESAISALRNVSAKRLETRARQFLNGMARHGTTSVESKSGYGLDLRNELKMLRVQARLHRAPIDVVPTFLSPRSLPGAHENQPDRYLSWLCADLLPAIRRRSLAQFAALRCDGRVFNDEQSRRLLAASRDLGFQIKVRAGHCPASDAVRLAVEAGAIGVEDLDDESPLDVELLARSNVMAVLLPGRRTPARGLIDGDAAVALGSNFNPGARATYSMLTVVASACTDLGMTPAEAICAATVNSAYAIGLGHAAGSIEVGRPADLIVLNAADYREIPYHFGVNLVYTTIKRGAIIYQEAKVESR